MPKGCIIYCIEKGLLEKYTILSILSVKRFGGLLSKYDIFCFQPRKEFPISKNTKKKLAELDVTFIDKPLNTTHRYYSFANKSIVYAYMINEYAYEQYVFYDSDTIILGEPIAYSNLSADALMCPVYTKGLGINASDNENKAYWHHLFKLVGVEPEHLPLVETAFEHEKVIAYWNAGIIVFNGRKEICQQWNKLVMQLLQHKSYPPSGIFFVEQMSLAAVLLKKEITVHTLPTAYNFPLDERIVHADKKININDIKIMHHLGNLHLLNRPDFIDSEGHKIRWVNEKLGELRIHPKSLGQKIQERIMQIEKEFKERLYYFIFKFTNR